MTFIISKAIDDRSIDSVDVEGKGAIDIMNRIFMTIQFDVYTFCNDFFSLDCS